MTYIKITFSDGSLRSYNKGISGREICMDKCGKEVNKKLAMLVDGELWDLGRSLFQDCCLSFVSWEDDSGKKVFWHSSAHLMAAALEQLFPNIYLGTGPATKDGFYYDVDFGDYIFKEENQKKLVQTVEFLTKKRSCYIRIPSNYSDACKLFQEKKNPYKLELLSELQNQSISLYKQDNFIDLCKGPHIPHTGFIHSFVIKGVAGVFWRGDKKRKQLTRIYAISFPHQEAYDRYHKQVSLALQHDHRRLGKKLQFFTYDKKIGTGLPLWLPRGAKVYQLLETYIREEQEKAGYKEVITPHIAHQNLYKISGHYEKYDNDIFQVISTPNIDEKYLLKPMNCPHHCVIYQQQQYSYKALPVRLSEFGKVYRYEQHGEVHGLTRTRCFTQDDAHIFCRPDQIKNEIQQIFVLMQNVLQNIGFHNFQIQLSFRDPKKTENYIGGKADWDKAEKAIKEVLIALDIPFKEKYGEAAFYGPKIDCMVQDNMHRSWQLGTIQLDYQLPVRFNLKYVDNDNNKVTPVLIHRVLLGSIERAIALLLENTAGRLPFWLTAEQMVVIPITQDEKVYARKIQKLLISASFRVTSDERLLTLGKKIREHEEMFVPYLLIIGKKEVEQNIISVRSTGEKKDSFSITEEKLVPFFKKL